MNANSDSEHAAQKQKQTDHITDNPDYDKLLNKHKKPSADVLTPISVVTHPKNVPEGDGWDHIIITNTLT